MLKRILFSSIIVVGALSLSACTTCDLALWLGNDVCEIGSF